MFKKVKIVILALLMCCSLFAYDKLKREEEGIETSRELVEQSPVIISKPSGFAKGIIFIAHGYAGSTSLMSPIALSLAKAGYMTVRFDFFGHGRHSLPYYGSIVDVTGVTQLFVDQLTKIVNYYIEESKYKKALLIGHSMASDIIFRVARANENIYGAIGLSNYTNEITADKPKNVLIINGAWETRLRDEALKIFNDIGIDNPKENQLYGSIREGNARKALAIDNTGHFSILYSAQTQRAIKNWIDYVYGYEKDDNLIFSDIGTWTLFLLSSLLLGFLAFISIFPKNNTDKAKLNNYFFVLSIGSATVLSPIMAHYISISLVPFVTHNYLINHLFYFSLIASVSFWHLIKKFSISRFDILVFIPLLTFYIFVLGGVLDRYVSSFFVYSTRLSTFFYLIIVSVPIACLIQSLHQIKNSGWLKANLTKISVCGSLSIPIFFKPNELLVVTYAILMFLLFYFVFGFLSNCLQKRYKNVLVVGLANGVTLSWVFTSVIPLYTG